MADEARQRLIKALVGPPRSYAPSEFTTTNELRDERISQGLGWDTTRPGQEFLTRALTQLPLALRTAAPWMLSPNKAQAPGQFTYSMLDPHGTPRGGLHGRMIGEGPSQAAYVSWIGDSGHLENTLGPRGVRQLQRAFKEDFPEARHITGTRVSGARGRVMDENPDAVRPSGWRNPYVELP